MRFDRSGLRMRRRGRVTGVTAGLVMGFLALGACGQAEDFMAKRSESREAAAEAERLAAEVEALEQQALAEEEAREEAAAQAAAEAQVAQAALEAAQRQIAEKEALLAEREAQLRQQQALLAEKKRIAAQEAAFEQKERELLEQARELEAREINLAVAEDELRARAAGEEPRAVGGASEQGGWVEEDTSGEPDDEYHAAAAGGAPVGGAEEGDPEEGVIAESGWEAEAGREALPEEASSQATLQPGKVMEVEILETISSRTHRLGDTFSARLVQDLRAEDGTLVVPAGAEVEGKVVEVTPLKRVGGQASIGIEFTRIVLAPGESVAIRASVSELGVDRSKDKKKIIGATIAGAILGRVLGGKGSENAVLGAAVGAAAGTAATARTKGKDAEIPAGEMVALQLEEVVTVEIDMTGTVAPGE